MKSQSRRTLFLAKCIIKSQSRTTLFLASRNYPDFSSGNQKFQCLGGLTQSTNKYNLSDDQLSRVMIEEQLLLAPGWTSVSCVLSVQIVQTASWDNLGWFSSAEEKVVSPNIYHWWGNTGIPCLDLVPLIQEKHQKTEENTRWWGNFVLMAHRERLRKWFVWSGEEES